MKKYFTYKIKAGVILTLAFAMILSGSSAISITAQESSEDILSLDSDYIIQVENSSVRPGTTGHIVNVNGQWSEEIFGYKIEILYQTYAADETTVTDINLDECVGEDPAYFTWNAVPSGNYMEITVTLFYTFDFTPGQGIEAGDGKLINIIIDISGDARYQYVEIEESLLSSCFYNIISGTADPEFINGILLISAGAPEAPNQPEGPTEGLVGEQYLYETDHVTGGGPGAKEYKFNFTDGETGWREYSSMVRPFRNHIWQEPGTYEVRVKARNVFLEESDWSEPLIVEITVLEPIFTLSITGGNGITVNITNSGQTDATNVNWDIAIDGGLIILTKGESGTIETVAAGASEEVQMSVLCIGFGFLTDKPTITVSVICDEESSGEESEEAIILFARVII